MTDRETAGEAIEVTVVEHAGEFGQLLSGAVAAAPAHTPSRIDGVRIGTLIGFAENGALPLVCYDGQPGTAALPARAMLDLPSSQIGRLIVLMFVDGDPRQPLVLGSLHLGLEPRSLDAAGPSVDVEGDGRRLTVSAKDQIVLRCGKASLTLTREGKVILDGAYVSAHSSGVMRLQGGSVQIN
jgi:uncharacterized protein DUF6484